MTQESKLTPAQAIEIGRRFERISQDMVQCVMKILGANNPIDDPEKAANDVEHIVRDICNELGAIRAQIKISKCPPLCNSSTGIPIIFDSGTKTAGPSSTDENPN